MSYRFLESAVYAQDTGGKAHFVARAYDFSGGYCHEITVLGNKFYDVVCDGLGEPPAVKGAALPRLELPDLVSCFTADPTENMRAALAATGLLPSDIGRFVVVEHNSSVEDADALSSHLVSAKEVAHTQYDVSFPIGELSDFDICALAEAFLHHGPTGITALLSCPIIVP